MLDKLQLLSTIDHVLIKRMTTSLSRKFKKFKRLIGKVHLFEVVYEYVVQTIK